jgi:hypothetical protein
VPNLGVFVIQRMGIEHRSDARIGRRIIDNQRAKRRIDVRMGERFKAALHAVKSVVHRDTNKHTHGISFLLKRPFYMGKSGDNATYRQMAKSGCLPI